MNFNSILPFFYQKSDALIKRKIVLLYYGNFINAFVTLFFLLKYNLNYHYSESNILLLSLLVSSFFSIPILFKYKEIKQANILFLITSSISLIYMIYLAGGIYAPGIFWIVYIPIFWNSFLGKIGGIIGVTISILTLIVFTLCHEYLNSPMLVERFSMYHDEKVINIFLFSIVTYIYVAVHTYSFESANNLIKKNKLEIENLLRLLVHDVATPVMAIDFRVDKLLKEQTNPELEKIKSSVNSVIEQIEFVREVKSIQDRKTKINLVQVELDEVIEEALALVSNKLDEKGIIVSYENFLEFNKVLIARSVFKNQIIVNILTNAIKFSYQNGEIVIKMYNQAGNTFLEISDHGMGMPSELLKNIFSLNHATSRAGTVGEKGTGYGMPLMKIYLEAMNVKVEVTSKEKESHSENHGTTFKLIFEAV